MQHSFLFIHNNKKELKEESYYGSIQRFKLEKSRRLGISLSGTGKELENVLTHQDNMVQTNVKNYQNMVYNYVKNKNYVTYME